MLKRKEKKERENLLVRNKFTINELSDEEPFENLLNLQLAYPQKEI